MRKRNYEKQFLSLIIGLSLLFKMVLIFKYKNSLNLGSDDLNYVKSAVVLIKRGELIFHNYNEPTVFIMPLYPIFLAAVFKVFGYGLYGYQAVRVIQAVFSSVTIVMVYLTGKHYFNRKIGFAAASITAFYIPNIVTTGYILTETLFTALLCVLVYLSIKFSYKPDYLKFFILGLIWTAATLCRPTIALYPILLFFYIFIYHKMNVIRAVKYGTVMFAVFTVIMLPWWIRNYREYGEFIPLAASSGNPMLQGTYVNYKQTPKNIVYYSLGKNAFETNKNEVDTAKKRIKSELNKDFWEYIKWFTLGKTHYFWETIFYWKTFFSISPSLVIVYHSIVLAGFFGIILLVSKGISRYILPISVIIYFNAVHCVYMAYDRYAFPLLPLLSVFSAYFFYTAYKTCKPYPSYFLMEED